METKFKWLMKFAAVGTLAMTAYLLWQRDAAAAGVAAGTTLGLLLYEFFPSITELKAFGFEAKIDRKLSEADAVLKRLRDVGLALSQATFLQLAYANRLSSPSLAEICNGVSAIDKQFKDLGATVSERDEAKRPFIMMVIFELARKLHDFLDSINESNVSRAAAAYEGLRREAQPVDSERVKRLSEERRKYSYQLEPWTPEQFEMFLRLRSVVSDLIIKMHFDNRQAAEAEKYCEDISKMIDDTVRAGNATPEAQREIAKYPRKDDRYREIFGDA